MLRIDFRKRAICFVCAMALAGGSALAESESLISSDLIQAETANYETAQVRRGTYERSYSSGASEYYPYTYQLRYEGNGAKFGEYTVSRGDMVKAGDVLATFTLEEDEVALSSLQLSLVRAQEDFAAGLEEQDNGIAALSEQYAAATSQYERELLSLQIARAEIALEQYTYQQERQIASLQEDIADLEAARENHVLLAPYDGEISAITYKREGDMVSSNEVLITLSRMDGMLLRVDNSSGYFRYGMQVIVEVGPAKERVQLTGQVVGADTLLPESRRLGYAFIALDPYDAEEIRFINPTAHAPTYYLENVLLLPRRAATLESGQYYVTKLTDGMVQKRFVNLIMNNNTDAWILQGVSEGETVILD